jgi:hypothetical protein
MVPYPNITARVAERRNVTQNIFEAEIVSAGVPVVLKGLVNDWPVVAASRQSHVALASYLKTNDSGVPVETFVGKPEMQGRYSTIPT